MLELVRGNRPIPRQKPTEALIEGGGGGAHSAESDRAGRAFHLMGEALGFNDRAVPEAASLIARVQQPRHGCKLVEQLDVVPLDQGTELLLYRHHAACLAPCTWCRISCTRAESERGSNGLAITSAAPSAR